MKERSPALTPGPFILSTKRINHSAAKECSPALGLAALIFLARPCSSQRYSVKGVPKPHRQSLRAPGVGFRRSRQRSRAAGATCAMRLPDEANKASRAALDDAPPASCHQCRCLAPPTSCKCARCGWMGLEWRGAPSKGRQHRQCAAACGDRLWHLAHDEE